MPIPLHGPPSLSQPLLTVSWSCPRYPPRAGARSNGAGVGSAAGHGAWFSSLLRRYYPKIRTKLISDGKKQERKRKTTYRCPNDDKHRLGHAFAATGGVVGGLQVVFVGCCCDRWSLLWWLAESGGRGEEQGHGDVSCSGNGKQSLNCAVKMRWKMTSKSLGKGDRLQNGGVSPILQKVSFSTSFSTHFHISFWKSK